MNSSIIKHVQQGEKDCVLACIAMVADKTLEEVHALFPEYTGNGVQDDEEIAVLNKLGLTYVRYFDPYLVDERVYIISVPSLNYPGMMHKIVVDYYFSSKDTCFVFDPNKGKEGRKVYEVLGDIKGWANVMEIPFTRLEND